MNTSIALLKGIADKTRLRIIDLLLRHDFCVGALAVHLEISKAAVSQHLQILRKAGLVSGEKRGYWTHYSVNKAAIHQLANELIKMADQPPSNTTMCFMKCPDKQNDDKQTLVNKCKGGCATPCAKE
ncbi:MAG: metalloregulator ArsR/SmtB family transcription factor [Desulfatitalea sp.]|nr:metalloregulator ArsR/SmtB family transcription factor [Desulfatitalea sp.]